MVQEEVEGWEEINDVVDDDDDVDVQDNADAGMYVGCPDRLLDGHHGGLPGLPLVSGVQKEEGHQTQE